MSLFALIVQAVGAGIADIARERKEAVAVEAVVEVGVRKTLDGGRRRAVAYGYRKISLRLIFCVVGNVALLNLYKERYGRA